MSERVQGFCPACGGESLFLASGGYVTCSRIGCPTPTAVADLLEDREIEHIVRLEAKTFSVQHPMRERLDGALFDCGLHARIAALDGPPCELGIYRVHAGRPLHWERLPEVAS